MIQTIEALFFLCVVAALAYFAARFLGARAARLSRGRAVRLLDSVSLGPRRQAVVLGVGGRAFLLGVTDQCVSNIAELREAEVEALWGLGTGAESQGGPEFVSRLSGLLKKIGEGRKE